MLKRKCKITFISHGETVHTQENRISDSEKYPPLTENGHEEIVKVCEYIKERGVKSDKIYTSPAVRCMQTARSIGKVFKQDFTILENLHSRKCGILNGKTIENILKTTPRDYPSIADFDAEGGESLKEFNKRVLITIRNLVKENNNSRLIVITYPNVIQSVVASTLGVTAGNQYRILIKTGSLTQISFFENWASLIYSDYVPL